MAGLAKRFPTVNIILDHLSRPDLTEGAPYHNSVQLIAMSAFENIYLKITPPVFSKVSGTACERGKLLQAAGRRVWRIAHHLGIEFPYFCRRPCGELAHRQCVHCLPERRAAALDLRQDGAEALPVSG